MAKRYLGDSIDIHAGGEDLVFPHHENEIAQSECCNGVPFAKYWLHNAFLNIENRKMSKSLGNFFTVREIGEKYDLQVLRFFMLSAHYRSPLNFSAEIMEASKSGLERIATAVDRIKDVIAGAKIEIMSKAEESSLADLAQYSQRFDEAMDDDFNTADAISVIFELVKYANTTINEDSSKEYAIKVLATIESLSDILGLIVNKEAGSLDAEIEDLIAQRQAARANRDFAKADEIRDQLLAQGIVLEDTREGVKWKRA